MTHRLRASQRGPVQQAGRAAHLPVLVQANALTDPFCATVPEAGLDATFLFHDTRPTAPVARFQLLLRAFCSMQKTVSRAAMHDDRIELQIDAARLVIGDTDLTRQTGDAYFRPDLPRTAPNAARLAYLVQHHSLALRMRVSIEAPAELCDDICRLMVALHSPKAVILTEAGLVLSRAEFGRMSHEERGTLRKGPELPAVPIRYARPGTAPQGTPPSPFAGGNKTISPLDAMRAERIATRYCDTKQDKALSHVFRSTAPCALSGRDLAETAPDPFCDAVVFECRHSRLRVLTSLLVATMVLVEPAALGTDSGWLWLDLLRLA